MCDDDINIKYTVVTAGKKGSESSISSYYYCHKLTLKQINKTQ